MITNEQATRIIELLESIDASLKRKNASSDERKFTIADSHEQPYMAGIIKHLDKLVGKRMTAPEIAATIGLPYSGDNHAQRLDMGAALAALRVKRGRTGSKRYYVFQ